MPKRTTPRDARAFVQPSTRSQRVWTPGLIRAAEVQANSGTLRAAGDLCDAMLADDRIQSVAQASADALLGLDVSFEAAGDKRRSGRAVRALEAEEDWWAMFPEEELTKLLTWGRMLGVIHAQLAPWSERDSGRVVGSLNVWPGRTLGWDWASRVWTTEIDGGTRATIDQNTGQWIVFTPYGATRPWASGIWRGLSRLWLLKQFAIDDWADFAENAKRGIVTSPQGATLEQRKQLAQDLFDAGRDAQIALPPGFDFKLVEASAVTRDIYEAQINLANTAFAIAWRGGNLSTETKGGSFAAAQSQADTGDARKTRAVSQVLSTCLREQGLRFWADFNFGNSALAPWPTWDTDPQADESQRADVYVKVAQSLPALVTQGADAKAILDEFSIPQAEQPPAPTAPAAQPAPAPPPPAASAQLRPVAAKSPRAALVEGQVWIDALADKAIAAAPDALRATVQAVQDAIDAASGYDDLRRRLIDLADQDDDPAMRELVEHAVMLALAAGNLSGARETAR
jgi:hypothetical protein